MITLNLCLDIPVRRNLTWNHVLNKLFSSPLIFVWAFYQSNKNQTRMCVIVSSLGGRQNFSYILFRVTIETLWQKATWRRKGLFSSGIPWVNPLREAKAETQVGEELKQRPWRNVASWFDLHGLLTLSYTIQDILSEMVLPTVGWARLHQRWYHPQWTGPIHINH